MEGKAKKITKKVILYVILAEFVVTLRNNPCGYYRLNCTHAEIYRNSR